MNKIAVLLLVLTAAIWFPYTALAQQNALDILTVNAASRLEKCNIMSFEASLSKEDRLTADEAQQRFDLADGCIATAKKDTNPEHQAALALVKNHPKSVASLNIYYTYWSSAIQHCSSKRELSTSKQKLEQLRERLYSGR